MNVVERAYGKETARGAGQRRRQMSVSSHVVVELVAMTPADDFSAVPPFEIRESAEQRVPFVFNSPHSGNHYPERFLALTRLDRMAIRRSEDCYRRRARRFGRAARARRCWPRIFRAPIWT